MEDSVIDVNQFAQNMQRPQMEYIPELNPYVNLTLEIICQLIEVTHGERPEIIKYPKQ